MRTSKNLELPAPSHLGSFPLGIAMQTQMLEHTRAHTHTHTLSLSHCPVRDQRGVNTTEGTREKEESDCGFEAALPRGQGLPVS